MLKRVKCFLIAAIICVSAVSPVAAASISGLSNCKQTMTKLCWAACAQKIGKYYGFTGAQADICKYVFGNTNNQTATVYEAATAIQYTSGKTTTVKSSKLSTSQVTAEISAKRPFEIRVGWDGSWSNGHFVVCGGYTNGNLKILDPLLSNGSSADYAYSDLVNGVDMSGGYGVWTHSTTLS